jgi:SAM-dependent MidA family methyltransferase
VLRDRIFQRIRDEGPMPFDEYMRLVLYDPDEGYFATGPLRSDREGDFLTSPEVSPLFGETIARFVDAEAQRIGAEPVDVVEVGAGSGSLLRPLLDALRAGARAWVVEVSAAARKRLAERIPDATVMASLDELTDPVLGVIVANEVADNLPAALAVRRGSEWRERRVGAEGDDLAWVECEARQEVAAWADRFAGPVPEGGQVEVQLEAFAWMQRLTGMLEAGSVLVFDYGETGEGLAQRRAEGTLRTYRGHHLGPDPLLEPGATDVTADVDVGALAAAAEEAGADVEVLSQAAFLERWGLRERLRELRGEELALARDGDPMERLRVRSTRTEAETLLHPRGLGDFRVVVALR